MTGGRREAPAGPHLGARRSRGPVPASRRGRAAPSSAARVEIPL